MWQFGTSDIDDNERYFVEAKDVLKDCSLVLIRVHAGLTYFKKFERLRDAIFTSGVPLVVISGMPEDVSENRHLFTGTEEDLDTIRRYIACGGPENEYNMLAWLLREIDSASIDVCEPVMVSAQGLYLPGRGIVNDVPVDVSRPVIAVTFNQLNLVNGDLAHIDLLIEKLRNLGAEPYPVFLTPNPSALIGSIGASETYRRYLLGKGVDAVINTLPFSQLTLSDPGDGSHRECENYFDELGVPVIQATTMFENSENWLSNTSGLGPYELSMSVFWPEYDGQIISVPLASTERDGNGGACSRPIEDRAEAIAELAVNWASLKRTAPSDRRVAILLHQNPPRADMIGGAFALDAQESTVALLNELKSRGYSVENIPEDGNALTRRLLSGVSNESEWLSASDMVEKAADVIEVGEYTSWLESAYGDTANRMIADWGEPPGTICATEREIVVPGFVNGNIFIGLQPNRGMTDECVDIYHSQDITPPHNYLAFYRWLAEDFGAQAVIHMGCHGTLEWLPGKGTGLSRSCFPDIVFGHLPHIYPYAMSNPGEGMHAKRRNAAVIVDHLIPPMVRAGNYDELLDLESVIQEYLRAKYAGMDGKVESLSATIFEKTCMLDLFNDLGLEDDCTQERFMPVIERLYDYICDIKDNTIKNGLHVLGRVPEGETLEQTVYSLVRSPNGGIPSLRGAVARELSYDLDRILADPSGMTGDKTNGEVLDLIDDRSMKIISGMSERSFDPSECAELAVTPDEGEVISAICREFVPALRRTSDELAHIVGALDGRYVLPGPSGCITRGNAHLLPSGRNFYSIDPASIPTASAWETGCKMAEDMVARHVSENGTYPRQVGIVIWSTDTMKTGGDDIAYVLSLLGLRPVWSSGGGSVTGLEIIRLDELKRPRIDVVLRISGLFRDSFPGLIEMLDDAFETISGLDESDEDNYMLAHLRNDLTEFIADGMEPIEARRRARVRIFGDPPGNYGGGVDSLITTSQWENRSELADAYVEWGGYAYGRGLSGEDLKDYFRKRMSETDVTVKNHESRELDAFDNDDDYVFLGGMNATVETLSGSKPVSYMGDSSDPSRPRLRTLEEEGRFIYRSRVLNPKWIEGLKKHGYRGVQELVNLVEFSFGWDSTSDTMEDWMYESVADRFLFDEENRRWIEENNPAALRQMSSRLLEATERGMWNAGSDTVDRLKQIYLDSDDVLERNT